MKSDKIVVNASPVISLAKIGCADFLLKLFKHLIIPEGVVQEIMDHKLNDPAIEWLNSIRSLNTVSTVNAKGWSFAFWTSLKWVQDIR
jgi:predicted nucleic acid-binding protein